MKETNKKITEENLHEVFMIILMQFDTWSICVAKVINSGIGICTWYGLYYQSWRLMMLTSKLFKRVIFNALSFSKSTIHNLNFSVCLVRTILREMKKEEEKIGEKIVGRGVLVEKREGKRKWWSKVIFSLDPPKHDPRKLGKKCKRKQVMLLLDALDDIVLPTNFPFLSISSFMFLCLFLLLSFVCLFFFFLWDHLACV